MLFSRMAAKSLITVFHRNRCTQLYSSCRTVPGSEQRIGLRDLSDAQAIRPLADKAENILVVGSGLVGMDAAYAFLEQGKAVTVVEMAGSVFFLYSLMKLQEMLTEKNLNLMDAASFLARKHLRQS